MNNQQDTSLRIRLAGIAILCLFIALAAAAYLNGRLVKRNSDLISMDAVPGTIAAHQMRMAMSRSVGWVMVAASAQTTQSRDASLKTVHDADVAFTNAVKQYEATIIINPAVDRARLALVTRRFAEYQHLRLAYEALILAGNRDASAVFLERDLVPAFVAAIQPAEELIAYNHANSITYANYIHNSIHHLYWVVAVVTGLAFICAVVLVVSFTNRRRELMELRESEEKFSKAFQANPIGIAITEMETGEYLEVNESFCRLMGYLSEELIGRTPVELGIWSSAKERNQTFQSLLAGETLRDHELQIHTRGGGGKTVLVNAEMIELGGKRCILSLVQDITERKRLEHKQAELAAIVASSGDAIIGKSLTGIITSWNRGAEKIFGYSAAEAIGQPLLMLMPADRQHEETTVLGKIERGETVEHYETLRIRKDGRQIYISATISPLKDGQGKVVGASKIARDITASKQAQDELIWKTALLVAQADSTIDGILVVDEQGRRILQNQQFLKSFQVPEDIARNGDDTIMLQHVVNQMKNPGQFKNRVDELYAHPEEIGRDEIELADGRVFDRYSAPIRDKAGKRFGRIWTFRDITDRRKLEAQFRQSQKMEAFG